MLKDLFFSRCKFKDVKCKAYHGGGLLKCTCGKGSSTTIQAAKTPSAGETASQVAQASLQYDPQMAQLQYNILTNPNYGLGPTTQAFEQTRQELFPGEQAVRQALQNNVLQNLLSPTGMSAQQQGAIDTRRGTARTNLQDAMRNQANLGGGLYGGRAEQRESNAMVDLENQFATEDIAMDERSRLNAIQSALPFLSILFPEVGIQQPQFQSAVPNANNVFSAQQQTSQGNQQAQIAAANNRTALQSSMWNAVGQGVGGAAMGFFCWVAKEIFGSWGHPKVNLSRYFIGKIGPKWFLRFYIKNGQAIAMFIHHKPILKMLIRPLFEVFALIAAKEIKSHESANHSVL